MNIIIINHNSFYCCNGIDECAQRYDGPGDPAGELRIE